MSSLIFYTTLAIQSPNIIVRFMNYSVIQFDQPFLLRKFDLQEYACNYTYYDIRKYPTTYIETVYVCTHLDEVSMMLYTW